MRLWWAKWMPCALNLWPVCQRCTRFSWVCLMSLAHIKALIGVSLHVKSKKKYVQSNVHHREWLSKRKTVNHMTTHDLHCVCVYMWVYFEIRGIWCDPSIAPQWGAVDAEIKVSSGENVEFKHFPFKALNRSVHSHTCYAYCQGFLPCLFLSFRSTHLHFFQNFSQFLLCWLWLTHGSCVSLQNKIGHPARCRFPCWVPVDYK